MSSLNTRLIPVLLLLVSVTAPGAQGDDEGLRPFEDLGRISSNDLSALSAELKAAIEQTEGLRFAGSAASAGPDVVREWENDRDGRSGWIVMLDDEELTRQLLAAADKYYAGALQRFGFYEDTAGGVRLTMLNPETYVRIIANDLESDETYEQLARAAKASADRLRNVAGRTFELQNPLGPVGPARDLERLRKGKKDMFMMVGPLTFYRSDSQFPSRRKEPLEADVSAQIVRVADEIEQNLTTCTVSEADLDYRWCANTETDLRWTAVTRLEAPGKAVLLGITRPRTEALAAQIVGGKRKSDEDRSPGLDHLCAFPIEVLIYSDGENLQVRTARQMFRMDLFFWDAGKGAFMSYAKMPAMLDRSIQGALKGK